MKNTLYKAKNDEGSAPATSSPLPAGEGQGEEGSSPSAKPPAKPLTVESLQAELKAANEKIAQFTAGEAANTEKEKQIAAKMRFGLTRQQAIAVIDRQAAYDVSPQGKLRAAEHAKRQQKLQDPQKS